MLTFYNYCIYYIFPKKRAENLNFIILYKLIIKSHYRYFRIKFIKYYKKLHTKLFKLNFYYPKPRVPKSFLLVRKTL